MTEHKDFKRLVRSRMQKTGESYAAARASLLAKKPASAAPPLPDDYQKVAGMTDAAVQKATGKAWPEWAAVLDRAGAASWEHRAIATHLHDDLGVPSWWTQMIAVGYERLRGLRATGQRRDGSYEVSKSKTLAVPADVAWQAFAQERLRRKWMPDLELTVTTANRPKSMRTRLADGSRLDVYFTPKATAKTASKGSARRSAKGAARCSVTLQHRALPDAATKDRMRTTWTERLEALRAMLETP